MLAACCLLVGTTTTHGLAGRLRHSGSADSPRRAGDEVEPAAPLWRFFQPFRCAPCCSWDSPHQHMKTAACKAVLEEGNLLAWL